MKLVMELLGPVYKPRIKFSQNTSLSKLLGTHRFVVTEPDDHVTLRFSFLERRSEVTFDGPLQLWKSCVRL